MKGLTQYIAFLSLTNAMVSNDANEPVGSF